MGAAGAVLLQEGEGGIGRPVYHFSRKLDFCQLNYSVMEKEVSAVIGDF